MTKSKLLSLKDTLAQKKKDQEDGKNIREYGEEPIDGKAYDCETNPIHHEDNFYESQDRLVPLVETMMIDPDYFEGGSEEPFYDSENPDLHTSIEEIADSFEQDGQYIFSKFDDPRISEFEAELERRGIRFGSTSQLGSDLVYYDLDKPSHWNKRKFESKSGATMKKRLDEISMDKLPMNEDGTYPKYSDGGYPIYYTCKDGGTLCPDCVNNERPKDLDDEYPDDDQWIVIDFDINYEDFNLKCDHCYQNIECAYCDGSEGDGDLEEESDLIADNIEDNDDESSNERMQMKSVWDQEDDSDEDDFRYQMESKSENNKTLNEGKKLPDGTLYIANSSLFTSPSNKYDIPLFSKTLKDAGATKVWSDNAYGWSNQPKVVLFTGLSRKKAEDALEKLPVFKRGAIIHDANSDWEKKDKKEITETRFRFKYATDGYKKGDIIQANVIGQNSLEWKLKIMGSDDVLEIMKDDVAMVNDNEQMNEARSRSGGTIEDDTPILPTIVADVVYGEMIDDPSEHDQNEIVDKLCQIADRLYKANPDFKKKILARGDRGRDALKMFMKHWLEGYLKTGRWIGERETKNESTTIGNKKMNTAKLLEKLQTANGRKPIKEDFEGFEGQDRESYSDDQDRENYTDDSPNFQAGDLVYWTDPNDEKSGMYAVVAVQGDVLTLSNDENEEVEALVDECDMRGDAEDLNYPDGDVDEGCSECGTAMESQEIEGQTLEEKKKWNFEKKKGDKKDEKKKDDDDDDEKDDKKKKKGLPPWIKKKGEKKDDKKDEKKGKKKDDSDDEKDDKKKKKWNFEKKTKKESEMKLGRRLNEEQAELCENCGKEKILGGENSDFWYCPDCPCENCGEPVEDEGGRDTEDPRWCKGCASDPNLRESKNLNENHTGAALRSGTPIIGGVNYRSSSGRPNRREEISDEVFGSIYHPSGEIRITNDDVFAESAYEKNMSNHMGGIFDDDDFVIDTNRLRKSKPIAKPKKVTLTETYRNRDEMTDGDIFDEDMERYTIDGYDPDDADTLIDGPGEKTEFDAEEFDDFESSIERVRDRLAHPNRMKEKPQVRKLRPTKERSNKQSHHRDNPFED